MFEIQVGTEIINRVPCPACCGCGNFVGATNAPGRVGRCRSCFGSRVECFEDYAVRVLSWFRGGNRAAIASVLDVMRTARA